MQQAVQCGRQQAEGLRKPVPEEPGGLHEPWEKPMQYLMAWDAAGSPVW